jgi:hypothetical protein
MADSIRRHGIIWRPEDAWIPKQLLKLVADHSYVAGEYTFTLDRGSECAPVYMADLDETTVCFYISEGQVDLPDERRDA